MLSGHEKELCGKYIQMSEVIEESNFVVIEDGKIVPDKVWVSEICCTDSGVDY